MSQIACQKVVVLTSRVSVDKIVHRLPDVFGLVCKISIRNLTKLRVILARRQYCWQHTVQVLHCSSVPVSNMSEDMKHTVSAIDDNARHVDQVQRPQMGPIYNQAQRIVDDVLACSHAVRL